MLPVLLDIYFIDYRKEHNLQRELTVLLANHFLRTLSLENKPLLRKFQVNRNLLILWNQDERIISIYLRVYLNCILKFFTRFFIVPAEICSFSKWSYEGIYRPCILLTSNFALYWQGLYTVQLSTLTIIIFVLETKHCQSLFNNVQ